MTAAHRRLATLVRVIGTLDLLAFAALLLPLAWLRSVHAALGMGDFPEAAVAVYLARTASLLYGLCGVLLLYLSTDIPRYVPVIRFIARCGIVAGVVLIGVDLASQMPVWWTLVEGPSCLLLWGLVWSFSSTPATRPAAASVSPVVVTPELAETLAD